MTDVQPIAGELLKQVLEKMRDPSVDEAEVAKMLASALQESARNLDGTPLQLRTELEGLAAYIQNTRSEIAALQATEAMSQHHIPSATDELDAVVLATEEATTEIMNCCDEIGVVAARVGGADGEAITAAVMRIFEACSFQDVSGQRIGKVVKTLKHIEGQVNHLVGLFGGKAAPASAPSMAAPEGDRALMNGPQLPGNAASQDDIDKLLAGLDGTAQ